MLIKIGKDYEVSVGLIQNLNYGSYDARNIDIKVEVIGEKNSNHFVIDYKDLNNIVKPIFDEYIDHRTLIPSKFYDGILTNYGLYNSCEIFENSFIPISFSDNYSGDIIKNYIKYNLKDIVKQEIISRYSNIEDVNLIPIFNKDPWYGKDNIKKSGAFHALHRVRTQAVGGTCLRIHGHDYEVSGDPGIVDNIIFRYNNKLLIDKDDVDIWSEIDPNNNELINLSYIIQTTYGASGTRTQKKLTDWNNFVNNILPECSFCDIAFYSEFDYRIFFDITITEEPTTVENMVSQYNRSIIIKETKKSYATNIM